MRSLHGKNNYEFIYLETSQKLCFSFRIGGDDPVLEHCFICRVKIIFETYPCCLSRISNILVNIKCQRLME